MKEEIRVFPDAPSLAQAAAIIFMETVIKATAGGAQCSLALSGGRTPQDLFRLLAEADSAQTNWEQTHFFWADERVVPPEHKQSNFRLAWEAWLSRLALPPGNIHRIRGELPAAAAAESYEGELRFFFRGKSLPEFDLILLGLGEDGHTASLFPGSSALEEKQRLALPVYHAGTANWRVTLTLPVLNNASRAIFLVAGVAKAPMVKAILGEGEGRPQYPAGLVKLRQGQLLWLLDEAAATGL